MAIKRKGPRGSAGPFDKQLLSEVSKNIQIFGPVRKSELLSRASRKPTLFSNCGTMICIFAKSLIPQEEHEIPLLRRCMEATWSGPRTSCKNPGAWQVVLLDWSVKQLRAAD